MLAPLFKEVNSIKELYFMVYSIHSMSFLTKIFGDPNARVIAALEPTVLQINALEVGFKSLSDEDLKKKTDEFRARIREALSHEISEEIVLREVLPEAFAAVREAARRTLGQRHYDVQLMGGIALHQSNIAEMKTGEGKTLVATLPVYLNALSGKGAHVVTVNDYLARRDMAWMGQIYDALGLSVGCINHAASFLYDSTWKQKPTDDKERDLTGNFHVVEDFLRPVSRREAYAADITYGTNNEYGFDYLRDNMVSTPEEMVQRGHHFAIVDEVDSILIDEARTPLIISAPDEESGDLYNTFATITPHLHENVDYNVDEKLKAATITDAGIEKVEHLLGVSDIYTEKGMRYVHHLEQALRAATLYQRDRDYVVKSGEVIIVDEFTGRLMPGRRWSEGLHQAIEAKEGVAIQRESRTLATITFQNYFRLYTKLAGMTGTAVTSAEEFHKVYKLDVVQVPPNKPLARKDLPDKIFQTDKGKWMALVATVKERSENGQPVLIGTVSIEKNEKLSALLSREGVTHQVLNAKNHEQEAAIIAQAGKPGAVTVATNMAGRGVDIILGGNPANAALASQARESGGLLVIGTERHEARRIDNQLRGRSGRQGDPGESQFYVSMEDDLMRIFGPGADRVKNLMARFQIPEDEAMENKMVSRSIEAAQNKIEGFHFDTRKHVLEYDDVMNKQRTAIYNRRKQVLFADESALTEELGRSFDAFIDTLVAIHAGSAYAGEWNHEEIGETIQALIGPVNELHAHVEKLQNHEELRVFLKELLVHAHQEHMKKFENAHAILRTVMLQAIDMLWIDHLEAMDYMRNSVRLRAYGQRDPLVEYKNEGAQMFRTLEQTINSYIVESIFRVSHTPHAHTTDPAKIILSKPDAPSPLGAASPADSGLRVSSTPVSHPDGPGRNDPCPCGSGRKYKKCGMLNTEEHQRNTQNKK
jgi:preprotein translocase subunit SecA